MKHTPIQSMSEPHSDTTPQSSWPTGSSPSPASGTNERQSANAQKNRGITMKDVGKANIEAQVRGSLIGLTIGVSTAALGKRYWRLTANQAFLAAFLTGMSTAYGSTRWLLSRYLAELRFRKSLTEPMTTSTSSDF